MHPLHEAWPVCSLTQHQQGQCCGKALRLVDAGPRGLSGGLDQRASLGISVQDICLTELATRHRPDRRKYELHKLLADMVRSVLMPDLKTSIAHLDSTPNLLARCRGLGCHNVKQVVKSRT